MTRPPRLLGRTPTRSRRQATHAVALACGTVLLSVLCAACGAGIPQTRSAPELTDHNRELYARTNLEHARALVLEGRLDYAESRTRRGLGYKPDDVQLLRLRAEILEDLGRGEEAAALRARVDTLDPPPAPPPSTADPRFENAAPTVLLLPPSAAHGRTSGMDDRVPQAWPKGEEAAALSERVVTRIAHARVLLIDSEQSAAETVVAAGAFLDREAPRGALSVRVERAYCGNSVKDGRFAIAWLRVAAANPGAAAAPGAAAETATEPHLVRVTVDRPPREGCKAFAIVRAFERALEIDAIRETLAAGATAPTDSRNALHHSGHYAGEAIRVLFPAIAWRVTEEVDQGRRYLAVGELEQSKRHFERALEIDPEDASAAAFLTEVDRSLALARHLSSADAPSPLDPQLSDAQRTGMEAQLAYERQRREEMLSALAVLYETRNAPTPGTVANMRSTEERNPSATGTALAMRRVPDDTAIEARTLFAPDGTVLARYYFTKDGGTPLLREDDTDGDGLPDRWVGYEDGLIREIWESDGVATQMLHVVYSLGGGSIERIEFDQNGNGEADRVFVYASGLLQDEAWDTDGDGSFDRFQQFDESGSLTMREEDVDGDDEIDIRTAYNNGRIIRREILNSDLLEW